MCWYSSTLRGREMVAADLMDGMDVCIALHCEYWEGRRRAPPVCNPLPFFSPVEEEADGAVHAGHEQLRAQDLLFGVVGW